MTDPENVLQPAVDYKLCQHMIPQSACLASCNVSSVTTEAPVGLSPCPTSDDIKYRVTRVSIDCVDIYLAESGAALNVQVGSRCDISGRI